MAIKRSEIDVPNCLDENPECSLGGTASRVSELRAFFS